jgi:hypothetical protein
MKKIAVFGISGFSGRNFEKSVFEAGYAKEYEFFGLDISFLVRNILVLLHTMNATPQTAMQYLYFLKK